MLSPPMPSHLLQPCVTSKPREAASRRTTRSQPTPRSTNRTTKPDSSLPLIHRLLHSELRLLQLHTPQTDERLHLFPTPRSLQRYALPHTRCNHSSRCHTTFLPIPRPHKPRRRRTEHRDPLNPPNPVIPRRLFRTTHKSDTHHVAQSSSREVRPRPCTMEGLPMARSTLTRNHLPQNISGADINPHIEQRHPQIPIISIQKNRGPKLHAANRTRKETTSNTISPSNQSRRRSIQRRAYTPLTSSKPRTPSGPPRLRLHPSPSSPSERSQPMAPTHL